MKLYENVVIGNVLYGLGYSIGGRLRGHPLPSAVNLLQQTPEDKRLGDVLLNFPGVVRLIEFKAEGNRSPKERDRHAILTQALQARSDMVEVSRQMHWYIETAPSTSHAVLAYVEAYLNAFGPGERLKTAEALPKFIAKITDCILSGSSPEDARAQRDYLDLVSVASGTKATGSGALVLVGSSSGGLGFAALQDIRELNMMHDRWIEHHQKIGVLALSHEPVLQRKLEREAPSYEPGM
ncbi:hypothetical protein A9975_29285 [Cupriavidus sp. UME77]|nr:hypothetical protein [Cupriavidus sp. UME77]